MLSRYSIVNSRAIKQIFIYTCADTFTSSATVCCIFYTFSLSFFIPIPFLPLSTIIIHTPVLPFLLTDSLYSTNRFNPTNPPIRHIPLLPPPPPPTSRIPKRIPNSYDNRDLYASPASEASSLLAPPSCPLPSPGTTTASVTAASSEGVGYVKSREDREEEGEEEDLRRLELRLPPFASSTSSWWMGVRGSSPPPPYSSLDLSSPALSSLAPSSLAPSSWRRTSSIRPESSVSQQPFLTPPSFSHPPLSPSSSFSPSFSPSSTPHFHPNTYVHRETNPSSLPPHAITHPRFAEAQHAARQIDVFGLGDERPVPYVRIRRGITAEMEGQGLGLGLELEEGREWERDYSGLSDSFEGAGGIGSGGGRSRDGTGARTSTGTVLGEGERDNPPPYTPVEQRFHGLRNAPWVGRGGYEWAVQQERYTGAWGEVSRGSGVVRLARAGGGGGDGRRGALVVRHGERGRGEDRRTEREQQRQKRVNFWGYFLT